MDYANSVNEFFSLLRVYIEKVISFFSDEGFNQLLVYLFDCIPEEIRFILLLFVLFVVTVGFLRLFRE